MGLFKGWTRRDIPLAIAVVVLALGLGWFASSPMIGAVVAILILSYIATTKRRAVSERTTDSQQAHTEREVARLLAEQERDNGPK
jgi:hypothetical protein